MNKSVDVLSMSALTGLPDFAVGPLLVSPARRLVEGPCGNQSLQPQVMLVLLCLAEREGEVVTRRALFDRCWGGVAVGDDSLNRAITRIRQALAGVGAGEVLLETIPATGYRLAAPAQARPADRLALAVEAAVDCWRTGAPQPDAAEIDALSRALSVDSGDAQDWGIFALLLRKAAEYANAADCSEYARSCERAVRKALSLDSGEPNARVARAGLIPLFGNWSTVRPELMDIVHSHPANAPARHDLVFLEMSTGRPSAALPLLEQLLREDRFAATYYYKGMYQLWTMGRLRDSEQVAARGMALWPNHPAIWLSRFWVLLGTGRAAQALKLASDEGSRPSFPPAMMEFLNQTAAILASDDTDPERRGRHVARTLQMAASGPANAVSALQALCALNAVDEAFDVARGYYLGEGSAAAPLRWNATDPSVTDQYRRLTQPLFIPSAQEMRADPRFITLCDDIGLSAYWDRMGVGPDFLDRNGRATSD